MTKVFNAKKIKKASFPILCLISFGFLSTPYICGQENEKQPKKKPIVSSLKRPTAGAMKGNYEQDAEGKKTDKPPAEKKEIPVKPSQPEIPPRPAPPQAQPRPGGPQIPPRQISPQPGAQPKTNITQQGEFITLDFKGEIKDLIPMFSDLMGKNIIYDENIRDKIIIIAPKKLTKEEAWNVFLQTLDFRGYNVVENKETIRILKSQEVRQSAIDTILEKEGREVPDTSQLVTYVSRLKYASADQIRGAVAQLISPKTGNISTYNPTNTLIITDTAENIKRLLKIIDAIDVAGLEERPVITVLPLKNASAKSLAAILKDILTEAIKMGAETARKGAKPAPAAPSSARFRDEGPKIIPDERLNSLIIVADLDTTNKIEELLEILDAPVEKGTSKVNVYYLNNAVAEDLAGVLNGIVSKSPKATAAAAGKQEGGQPAAPLFGKEVVIAADKSTNALIISASPDDYLLLKEIIGKLDIMKPQVFVESLIIEVSQNKLVELGVDLNFLRDLEDTDLDTVRAIGLTNFGSLAGLLASSSGKIPSFPSGGSVAVTKGYITLKDGTKVLNITALGTAFASVSGINVVAQPQIITADNEEAEITIGENRRFIRSSTIVSETANTVNTFEFRDVALNLKITPHINTDGFVKMEIEQTVENVLPGSSSEQGVETSKREAKTTVVAKNMETIIIGGLIRETNTPTINKIPCLGDIPVIGWFAKKVSNTKEKTNLLIFLKPTIINTPVELAELTQSKKEKAKQLRKEDENKKDIFYKTIIDGKYKFWKDDEPVPMLEERSKLLESESKPEGERAKGEESSMENKPDEAIGNEADREVTKNGESENMPAEKADNSIVGESKKIMDIPAGREIENNINEPVKIEPAPGPPED